MGGNTFNMVLNGRYDMIFYTLVYILGGLFLNHKIRHEYNEIKNKGDIDV